jgi:formylglycine-generating enzyme required for sulfatase activity
MKIKSALGSGLLSAFMLVAMHGDANAQRRRRVACEEGQHVSGGHCCDRAGEEWVEARHTCVCLDAALCAGAPAATQTTPAVTQPAVTQPAVTQPTVTQPTVTQPAVTQPAVTQPAVTQPAPSDQQYTCPEGMVLIRGTTFMAGSVPGVGDADELPAHRVTVAPYCIDRTEVTVGQYRGCMQGGTCSLHTTVNLPGLSASDAQMYSQYCNGARTDRDNHPINCVDWSQADTFCHSRNGRLPTEAEWELAARGPDQRLYPWGQPAPSRMLLNGCDADCQSLFERPGRPRGATIHDSTDGFGSTAPVGTFTAGASLFGLQDMAGNVGEWVGDWYGPYSNIPVTDPTGPTSGTDRVVRGGHWQSSNPRNVRGAARVHTAPTVRLATVGFRCVAPAQVVAPPPPPPAPEPTPAAEEPPRRHHRGH